MFIDLEVHIKVIPGMKSLVYGSDCRAIVLVAYFVEPWLMQSILYICLFSPQGKRGIQGEIGAPGAVGKKGFLGYPGPYGPEGPVGPKVKYLLPCSSQFIV